MPRQRRRSRRGLQGKLAKQANSSKLLRLMLASVWFRLAVVGMVLVIVALGVALVPVFETSPEGYRPVIRVSGVNLIQAWRLQNNAEAATQAGGGEDADYYWRAALRKNPGNLDLARGALDNALAAESQGVDWLIASIGYANHYLKLSFTNEASVELVADFYEKRGLTAMIPVLLEPRRSELTPRQQQILLKALFRQRKFQEFRSLWAEMGPETRLDTETALFYSAFQGGWGSVEESIGSIQRLENVAAQVGEHQILARQLLLAVYGQNQDVERYGEVLTEVRNSGKDAHFHHAAYWSLLFQASRPNVARHQAEDYWMNLIREPVTSALELALVARAYDQIGLPEKALDLLGSFDEEFAASTEYWAAYGTVLVHQEDWPQLKVLALKIRNKAFSSRVIRAYSYFLEGLAEAGEGRTYNAGKAFDTVIELEADLTVDQAIEMAWEVYGIGYPEIASKLLAAHRADLELNLRYWEITFASAYKLKRADLILEAANRMRTLDPNNQVSLNNYAAALLVRRERPEEAIRFTLQLLSSNRSNPGFVMNHGLALLQNGRLEEAESYFRSLSDAVIRPEVASSLGLGWFELYYRSGEPEKAKQALLDVNDSHLFPEQRDWLDKAKQDLGIMQDDNEGA